MFRLLFLRLWFLAIVVAALSTPCWAEDVGAAGAGAGAAPAYNNLLGLSAGRMLPNGVYGARDIYPYWGLRFGTMWGRENVELSGAFIHSNRVSWYTTSAVVSFPTTVQGFTFIPTFGIDSHYYRGHTLTKLLKQYSLSFGLHLGVSPIIEITKQLSLRTDFNFGFNPGQTLFVGAGLQFNF